MRPASSSQCALISVLTTVNFCCFLHVKLWSCCSVALRMSLCHSFFCRLMRILNVLTCCLPQWWAVVNYKAHHYKVLHQTTDYADGHQMIHGGHCGNTWVKITWNKAHYDITNINYVNCIIVSISITYITNVCVHAGIYPQDSMKNYGRNYFSQSIFTLHLRRRYLYYVINLIVPYCLFSLMSVFTFVLPPSRPERLNLGRNIKSCLGRMWTKDREGNAIPGGIGSVPVRVVRCPS